MQFDLISDLHVDSWRPDQQVDWQGLGTSLVCVIAGDISRNLDVMYKTVVDISKHYKHVVFVEGNHEHAEMSDINQRREYIKERFSKYRNITYLYRSTIILDNTAFIGSNGWYSFDFGEPFATKEECFHYELNKGISQEALFEQYEMALEDGAYIANAVEICNNDPTVHDIVIVTHTLPNPKLAWFPPDQNYAKIGTQGNTFMEEVFKKDRRGKIKTWAFGHVHQPQDVTIDGVRYVSNPRGLPTDLQGQLIYYPKFVKY